MRLYLSSYRLSNNPEKLLEVSGQGRVAIVGNALDFIPDEARRKYEVDVYDPRAELAALGMETQDLDLRLYFGNPRGLRNALRGIGPGLGGRRQSRKLRRKLACNGKSDTPFDVGDARRGSGFGLFTHPCF